MGGRTLQLHLIGRRVSSCSPIDALARIFFSVLLLSSLELTDAKVCELQIRALAFRSETCRSAEWMLAVWVYHRLRCRGKSFLMSVVQGYLAFL